VKFVAQTLDTVEDLQHLSTAWRGLWQRAPAATVFQSPDWLIPWWRHFAPGQLLCIALWRGDELVACAPLYREAGSGRLLPLGISLSDYLDVLIADGGGQSARQALQAELGRVDCREICFPAVAPDAAVFTIAPEDFAIDRSPAEVAPELALGTADKPLKNVPAHQRQNLRTADNRARRRGCVVSSVAIEELSEFLPAVMQLHSARQKYLGREGLDRDPRVLPFFLEASARLARQGALRAYSLHCEARLIGGYVGFLHEGRASYYFGGFDPSFAFESPGTMLIGHAMRDAVAEGADVFDFLRGAEPYKYAWGAHDRPLVSLSFARQRADVELAS
jgi:CelD/BcsL family acetyltransferase involved in cellulose biosynthesis